MAWKKTLVTALSTRHKKIFTISPYDERDYNEWQKRNTEDFNPKIDQKAQCTNAYLKFQHLED